MNSRLAGFLKIHPESDCYFEKQKLNKLVVTGFKRKS